MLRSFKIPLTIVSILALSGCKYEVLAPDGWVAFQERDLLIIATALMLIVILPVLFMSVYFPLRYRADRLNQTDYDPNFTHSNKLELVVWGVPILIIVALGAYTWIYTHKLDPYRPLTELHAGKPVEVEAVSLDWKWLFIYPDYGVASVNELAIPAGRPVHFRLSSASVMNTLSIPALGGMVYSMAGMETQLHLIADKAGTYSGRSAHFSGPGFSQMTFDTLAMDDASFDAWIAKVKASDSTLTRGTYPALERPSIADPVRYYGSVEKGLFARIAGLCVEAGKVCVGEMMMQDAQGGGGLKGIPDGGAYEYDRQHAIDGFGRPLDLPPSAPGSLHEAALSLSEPNCGTASEEPAPHAH
ncbi:ubiquinol oxidase subunit II [Xanthobacter sediminis]